MGEVSEDFQEVLMRLLKVFKDKPELKGYATLELRALASKLETMATEEESTEAKALKEEEKKSEADMNDLDVPDVRSPCRSLRGGNNPSTRFANWPRSPRRN
eukprot:9466819-Pyramimonas_sp.AAC.2